MTPPTNPFADDVPVDAGELLESAGSPSNPYAAPAGSLEPEGAGPGVGIWRHKDYVVLHRDADFPDRCLFTNEPATYRWPFVMGERPDYLLGGEAVRISYCMSPGARREWFWKWLRGALPVGVWIASFLVFAVLDQVITFTTASSPFYLAAQWTLSIGPVIWLYAAYRLYRGWHPLRIVYTDGPYLLIAGAQIPFLSSLPRWPGLYAKAL